jgi:hypothetical protein
VNCLGFCLEEFFIAAENLITVARHFVATLALFFGFRELTTLEAVNEQILFSLSN